jgi:hypothetical protein
MLKKPALLLISLFFVFSLKAQDTLRVMVYNLLYYGEYIFNCDANNNNPNDKDRYLRTILSHDLPDIFVVNEISRNAYYHQRILDSVIHKISDRQYSRAASQNISGSDIMNMLYYNAEKLILHSQHIMQSIVRDIDLYTLYYRSPDLAMGDTAFIHCIAAHLKAGNSLSDQQTRRNQINNVITWLELNRQPGNFLFMGDLNVKTVEELSIQTLLFGPNLAFRFYDPVNQLGNWYNNPDFSLYHTQSTHTSGNCHSGGGLDDRFDFILASDDVIQGNKQITYVEGSYLAMGQDGQHFNVGLLDPPFNASAPFGVVEALFHNSDHLPVLLSLAVNQNPAGINNSSQAYGIRIQNPVNHELRIDFPANLLQHEALEIHLYSMPGKVIAKKTIPSSTTSTILPMDSLNPGLYLLHLHNNQINLIYKIVKI